MAGQNDRAFPVVMQYIDDKAYVVWPKSQQQREPVLKLPASSPYALNVSCYRRAGSRRPDQALRRLHRRQQRVVQGRSGRDPRPDRPERLGQEHDLQHAVRHASRPPRARSASRGARSPACRRTASSISGIGRTFQIPRPFRRLSIFENVVLAGFYGSDGTTRVQRIRGGRAGAGPGRPADRSRGTGQRARRGGAEEAGAGEGAGDRPEAAAGRREPRRAGRDRDGPGGRHAAPHPPRTRHHHHLGRAHHGRADARGGSRDGARSRREDRRGPAARGGGRSARDRGVSRHRCRRASQAARRASRALQLARQRPCDAAMLQLARSTPATAASRRCSTSRSR